MADIKKAKQDLALFNEKAERLHKTRFMKGLKEMKKISVTLEAKKDEYINVTQKGPDRDAIEAFVLTFRFFIQNNEGCSFGNIGETYNALDIPQELKDKYNEARNHLNDYLDTEMPSIVINGEKITRRRLLDVFVYGGLAHANPEKKELFDAWMRIPFLSEYLQMSFVSILIDVVRIINYVYGVNEDVLKYLE